MPELADMPELALLVDGHNLIFRSFSIVPRSITDPEGRPVNGVYGMVASLLRMIRDRRPDYVAVAFDRPEEPTFRHRLFPAYQGQRGPLGGEHAENFAWQVGQATRALEHFGIRCLVVGGFEADDIIGTLTRIAVERRVSALIVSTDRDLQQLVAPTVHVLIPGKNSVEVGPEDVIERLGLRPDQIVDWKVLAGDTSDNIPGIAGFGNKTALALLTESDTLAAAYDKLPLLPKRVQALLKAGRTDAELFERVVRIRTDVPIDLEWEAFRLDPAQLPEQAGEALRAVGLRPPESVPAQ